jgi:hypothetical protein
VDLGAQIPLLRHEKLRLLVTDWVRGEGVTYLVQRIDPSIQLASLNHTNELLLQRGLIRVERLGHAGQSNARERNEVLDNTLGANAVVERLDVALQMDVEEVVILVFLEDLQAVGVLGGVEVGEGAAHVGFQLQEAAEVVVVKNFRLQGLAVHGGERTQSTVDSYIVRRYNVVEATSESGRTLQEASRSTQVVSSRQVRQSHSSGELGFQSFLILVRRLLEVADLRDVGLQGQSVALFDTHAYDLKRHVEDVLRSSTEVAHPTVRLEGVREISGRIEVVSEVFVAHLVRHHVSAKGQGPETQSRVIKKKKKTASHTLMLSLIKLCL